MNYSIVSAKKNLVDLLNIGVYFSDNSILVIASLKFDSSDSNFENNKKQFLQEIHEMIGK
ncbi:hypothetical protein SAMN04487775_10795 [Treponema bryantii]|uniref:Uncharacterized protein n=1 Tax=Treponema bryantii TaxID=163 RepID=A0A1I3LN61_9SPIR|nr:hypothetical protein [Treponema bryantii]SFI86204.1 hypothetical protein SAMN04487775_10795 [Treponema bryantii]